MIPTAEEFVLKYNSSEQKDSLMVAFAKMHTIEALKQASENASLMVTTYCGRSYKTLHTGKKFTYNNDDYVEINVKRILDSYPLENIK